MSRDMSESLFRQQFTTTEMERTPTSKNLIRKRRFFKGEHYKRKRCRKPPKNSHPRVRFTRR